MNTNPLIEEDIFGNKLELDFLVVIAASSRYSHSPTFALYAGNTAKTFRYKVIKSKWDRANRTYNLEVGFTNLSPTRKRKASCLLIAPVQLTEEELFDIDDVGIRAIQYKGYV